MGSGSNENSLSVQPAAWNFHSENALRNAQRAAAIVKQQGVAQGRLYHSPRGRMRRSEGSGRACGGRLTEADPTMGGVLILGTAGAPVFLPLTADGEMRLGSR